MDLKSNKSSVHFIVSIDGEVNVLRELAFSKDPDRMFTTKIYDCFLTENNVTMIL